MASIEIRNVSKQYAGRTILSGLSLALNDGECFTLLGPSGCGKTTLLRLIAGFEAPDSGSILIGDGIVADAASGQMVPPDKRSLGMVFQDYAVWPHYSVFENVYYPLKKRGVPKAEARQRTLDAIEQVRMKGYEERMPAQLSGGQQQRVALARALVSSSDLVVLDEPISNLDANLREEMRFEIKELQRRTGITVIYVTHDQEVALAIADRMAILDSKGYIRQVGVPEDVYKNPNDRYVYQFLGVSNFIPLDRSGDGYVIRDVEGAPRFPCDVPADLAADGLYAACRPVDIRIGEGPVNGLVKHVVYLGNLFEYRVILGGREIRVQQDSHEAFAAGVPEEGRSYPMSFSNLRFYADEGRDAR